VATPKLGSINHTVMSLEVCRAKGIDVVALVYNYYPGVLPEIEKDTERVIRDYLAEHFPSCAFIRVGDLKAENPQCPDFSALL